MTIIVGVKCTDGIVIGSDSIAASSSGPVPVMQIQANEKITIFNGNLIVAVTGSVGLSQRLQVHVENVTKNGGSYKSLDRHEAAGNLAGRLMRDAQASAHPNHPVHGLGFGCLIAAVMKDGLAHLIEYDVKNFQPEFKEGKTFYVSMGSGQGLADPFLAFVSRVLWKNRAPDVRMGKFGVFWALSHTIGLSPGLVGPPIKLATLTRRDVKWTAELIDDNGESEEYIGRIEELIGSGLSASTPAGDPLPAKRLDTET